MTLEEFVKEINKIQNPELKQKQIKKHIKREYCPVKEKIDFLYRIKDKSSNNNSFSLFRNKILFSIGIVNLYTDIQIEYNNLDEKEYINYDILISSGILDLIIVFIEKDLEELLSFNEIVLNE